METFIRKNGSSFKESINPNNIVMENGKYCTYWNKVKYEFHNNTWFEV